LADKGVLKVLTDYYLKGRYPRDIKTLLAWMDRERAAHLLGPSMESSIFSDAQDLNFRLETHVFSKASFQTARRAMVYDIKEKGIRIA
jgi:hypothetical protein